MKKKIMGLLFILIIVGLTFFAVKQIKREENNELKKVTVADTTLTSRTYMS